MMTERRPRPRAVRSLVYLSIATVVAACGGGGGGSGSGYGDPPTAQQPPPPPPVNEPTTPPPPAVEASAFSQSALASDGSIAGTVSDVDVVNPWGLAIGPNAPAWFVNNATDKATIYDGTGKKANLVVTIPAGVNGAAAPTGIVANGTPDFAVTNGTTAAAARFIFAGEAGTISGWNPTVNPNTAITAYDDADGGAVYKGLAIASNGASNRLYATDFRNSKVDVFDGTYAKITVSGGFSDPTLPEGFAPYGIQAVQLDGQTILVVTYAQQDDAARDEVIGAGLGLVNTFDTDGNLIGNLVPQGGELNAPWGIALAPTDFGTLSNALLIANFGDGVINGFDAATGELIGALSDANGNPIQHDGLWAIAFGNGARNQPATTLYFTAGVANQAAGLYGRIDLGDTAPDIVAPTVAMTAPPPGELSGTVAVSADASDNLGVTQVQFLAGTTVIGTATGSPFSIDWDTATVENGSFDLTAQARDAFGNVTASSAVAVTVNNIAPPPPPPAVSLADLQATIFGPICSGCHTGAGPDLPASMNLSNTAATFASLVGVASLEVPALQRVQAGNADNSYLIDKLEGTQTVGARMPLFGVPLDQATIDQVRAWIDAGAPAP